MSDDFDFIKAFTNVDALQVEAVGEVVGRAVAALFRGMVAAGLPELQAHRIIRGALREMFDATLRPRA